MTASADHQAARDHAADDRLETLAAAWLAEDLGDGDATGAATVPAERQAVGVIATRAAGVVAGLDVAAAVLGAVDPPVELAPRVSDGDAVDAGAVLADVAGPARSLLAAERTALNLLGHLCGVATLTRAFVEAAASSGHRPAVRDTRKTLPGLRALQKAAVAAGGGVNHRMGLHDGLLVKDNHAALAGGVSAAAQAALRHGAAVGLPVQVEVDDLDELDEALAAGARQVLCDNFDLAALREAVARCHAVDPPAFVEASGGVTLATVAAIAATGVDAVAVGALTHSAPGLDVGLDLRAQERG